MLKKIFFSLLLCLSVTPWQAFAFPYKNPTGKEFPILAWYSIRPDSALTQERYNEMRNAGFNISFSHFGVISEVEKALKACKGTGVKQMVACPELENDTRNTVLKFKDNEMVAGWFLRDEPVASGFAQLRNFRDAVYESDSSHVIYLNLLPALVDAKALGTKDYEEYVQRFVDEVNLSQISYDFYPILDNGKKIFVRPEFYNNLEIIRKVALRVGQPFWAFVLSTAHDPYPVPTSTHMRLEAFSSLAYGAQCIQYFTYWQPDKNTWNFNTSPIGITGDRTHVYYLVKALNEEIHNLTWVFLGAHAESVGHTGEKLPLGTTALSTLPHPIQEVKTDGEGVLVSHLVNGSKHFLMIVNRDIDQSQQVTIKSAKQIKRVLPNGKTIKVGKLQNVTVPQGDYLLYYWK